MTDDVSGHRVFTSTSSQHPSKLLFVDSKAVASFIHAPTSPLGVVTAVLRGSISSLMEERKFCEIRKASCSKGKSGWSLGVCFSKSCTRKKQKLIQFIQLTTFLNNFPKERQPPVLLSDLLLSNLHNDDSRDFRLQQRFLLNILCHFQTRANMAEVNRRRASFSNERGDF